MEKLCRTATAYSTKAKWTTAKRVVLSLSLSLRLMYSLPGLVAVFLASPLPPSLLPSLPQLKQHRALFSHVKRQRKSVHSWGRLDHRWTERWHRIKHAHPHTLSSPCGSRHTREESSLRAIQEALDSLFVVPAALL